MTSSPDNIYYTGIPQQARDPDKWKKLPYVNLEKANDASLYVAPYGLRDAVNVALELGLPLLLTGEPGVGKSSLARSLNLELGYQDRDLLHFTVKSETRESELFYSYDTLGRFHAVHGQINIPDEQAKQQAKHEADPRRFIRYQGLGMRKSNRFCSLSGSNGSSGKTPVGRSCCRINRRLEAWPRLCPERSKARSFRSNKSLRKSRRLTSIVSNIRAAAGRRPNGSRKSSCG